MVRTGMQNGTNGDKQIWGPHSGYHNTYDIWRRVVR
jgi:hypothetical protein